MRSRRICIVAIVVGVLSLVFAGVLDYFADADKLPLSDTIQTILGIIVIAGVVFSLTYTCLFLSKRDTGANAQRIVEVEYLGVVDEVDKRGGLRGGLLGGLLYGPLGAPIGSLLPMGTKPVCRFAVTYGDGHTEIRDCVKGSGDYNYLNQYITFGRHKKHK